MFMCWKPGRPLFLCGVSVPHDKGLAGHSDADVGIHALCDAIYGALAEGDIGRHFPPTEAAWKDADSARFLTHAAESIAARGGRLTNADVTLICERPKITPHAPAMIARLASLLGVDPGACIGKGHDHRKTRLYRPWGGHCRSGCGIHPYIQNKCLLAGDCLDHEEIIDAGRCSGCHLDGRLRRETTGRGNPYPPVPALISETVPKPPVTAEPLMWQPGHWDWNGSGYSLGERSVCSGRRSR